MGVTLVSWHVTRSGALAVQVLLGMVWVWPESGPVAFIESAAAEPPVNQRVRDIDPGAEGLPVFKSLLSACSGCLDPPSD